MTGGAGMRRGRRGVSSPRRTWSPRSVVCMAHRAPRWVPSGTAELRAGGQVVNRKRVERLMRAHRIAGIRPRRPKRTTIPARTAPKLPDLPCRDFAPGAPDRAWVADITYVRTGQGWLYLAAVLDLGSRRLLGYQMSDRIDTRLAHDALDMAGAARIVPISHLRNRGVATTG